MNPNVQAYRERISQEQTVTAPSGFVFKVRRLTVMDYIKAGLSDIPNDFYVYALSLQTGVDSGLTDDAKKANLKIFEQYLEVTLSKGIVEPPVLLTWNKELEDTHLVWNEIPTKDQEFLLGIISGRIDTNEPKVTETGAGKSV